MTRLAFLDTGVVLAYCFKDDKHHVKCRNYVVDTDHEKYISDHVEEEYVRKEPTLAERHADGIFDHISRLRDLARDIEQNAIENRNELTTETETWTREASYPDIDEDLSVIHEEDRRICLDAHDVAIIKDDETELATTNPKDLVRDGHRELILDATALVDVVSLAVTN